MEGRWALGVFPGYDEPFWGRVAAMGCFGQYITTLQKGMTKYNYNYNYQMAPSKRGAGGGSATHKEPT